MPRIADSVAMLRRSILIHWSLSHAGDSFACALSNRWRRRKSCYSRTEGRRIYHYWTPRHWAAGDLYSSFNSFNSYSFFSSFIFKSLAEVWTEGSEWLSLRCLYISFFAMKHSTTVFISTLNCLRPFSDSIWFQILSVCELKFGCRIVQPVILVTLSLEPMVVKIRSNLSNSIFSPNFSTFK